MRKIARPELDAASKAYLEKLSKKVRTSKEAIRQWDAKSPAAFQNIRATLESMATGRARCMYCEDSQGTDIEHFYPKKQYPRRAFRWDNYLLACSHCNSNLKREQFPLVRRQPSLLNPTIDDPSEHLAFLPTTGEFAAVGRKGRPSIEIFGLNDTSTARNLPKGRRGVLLKLQLLLKDYDTCILAKDDKGAEFAKDTIQNEPFSAVLGWLLYISKIPGAARTLRPGIPALLRKHRVESW